MPSWKGSNPHQDEEEEEDDDDEEEDVDDSGEEDDEGIESNRRFSSHRLIIEEAEEEDDEYSEEEDDEGEDGAHLFNANDSAEFSIALKELKSIRSHLYSAAEYCESAYMHSDQKQVIFENLKDYSVKALVNAVDHVGTVASKLNDLLSKRTKEISVVEYNTSRVSQWFQACHDSANCEGLKHYQHVKRRPRYGQHYALAEAADSPDKHWVIVKKTSQAESELPQYVDAASESYGPKSLAWLLASETSAVSSAQSTPAAPYINRSTSSNYRGDHTSQGFLSRSLSGGQFSLPRSSPNPAYSNQIHELVQSSGASKKALSALLSLDETKRRGQQTHKKGLLSAFLGRTKSGVPKRLSTLTSFKQR